MVWFALLKPDNNSTALQCFSSDGAAACGTTAEGVAPAVVCDDGSLCGEFKCGGNSCKAMCQGSLLQVGRFRFAAIFISIADSKAVERLLHVCPSTMLALLLLLFLLALSFLQVSASLA